MLSTTLLLLRILIPVGLLMLSGGYVHAFLRNRDSVPGFIRPLFFSVLVSEALFILLLILETGAFPFGTAVRGLFLSGFILSLMLFGMEFIARDARYGVFLLPVNFLVTALSLAFFNQGHPLPAALMTGYYIIHVVLLFSAYACFLLSFVLALLYLFQYARLKTHRPEALSGRLPPLETLDQTVRFMDALGLSLLTLGLFTGFLWLDMLGGMPGSVGLKAMAVVLSGALYLTEHMLRIGRGWQGQRACLLSVAGFLMILCTLLVGRHGF